MNRYEIDIAVTGYQQVTAEGRNFEEAEDIAIARVMRMPVTELRNKSIKSDLLHEQVIETPPGWKPTRIHRQLTPTLGLTDCRDGVWLYDETRGMNLSMKAATSEAAFVEALTYYQQKLSEMESAYRVLKVRVDAFVGQFRGDEGA